MKFGGVRAARMQTKLEQRAAAMTIDQLVMYSEGELYDIGRALTDFNNHRGTDEVDYALTEANRLVTLLTALYKKVEPE
jgi:hypothetical protein